MTQTPAVLLVGALVAASLMACQSDELVGQDQVFFDWDSAVACGASIDNAILEHVQMVRGVRLVSDPCPH